MSKLKALKLLAVILLIATALVTVYAVQAFSPPTLPFDPEEANIIEVHYQANEIGKPLQFWVLTDPDPYILEAIEKSAIPETYDPTLNITWEHWTKARANETTFIYQVYEHGALWEIEHEGHYYSVDCLWNYQIGLPTLFVIHNARHEKELTIGLTPVFGVAWIALGTLWLKKKPTA